ncbi:MAG: hypothetical protein ACTS3F_03440 [Phycisphaerales bacterium]
MTTIARPARRLFSFAALLAATLALCSPVTRAAESSAPRGINQRLSELTPDNPMSYFLLAEDLGYDPAADERQRELARTLFLLAAAIDRERDEPAGLDRSAALALADLAETDAHRRTLRATAQALAADRNPTPTPGATQAARATPPTPWPVDLAAAGSDDLALRVAETLARARANDGVVVHRELERTPIVATLTRAGVDPEEARGIEAELRIIAATRNCPGCRNERIIRTRNSNDRSIYALCPVCSGNPGPGLTESQYLAHLRAEALVLDVTADNWSADLFLTDARPLADPGFEALLQRYEVDPTARYWRTDPGTPLLAPPRGRWVVDRYPAPRPDPDPDGSRAPDAAP